MNEFAVEQKTLHGSLFQRKFLVIFGVLLLLSSYVINAMDRSLFPLLLPDVRREYGFSLSQAGLTATFFTIGMAVAAPITNFLMSRFSQKTVLQIGLLLFSVATVLTVLSVGFLDMLLYRAITGVGEAVQLTILFTIFSNYSAKTRGIGIGAVNSMYSVGNIIGPLLGASILTVSGSWKWPMVAFGLLGGVMLVLIGTIVSSSITEHRGNDANASREHAVYGTPSDTMMNFNTGLLLLLTIVAGIAIYSFLSMYPTFLRESLHYSPMNTGKVMGMFGLGGFFISIAGGWLGDRVSPRSLLCLGFLFGAILCLAVFNGSSGLAFQSCGSFLFGGLFSGILYVNLVACLNKSVVVALRGRATSLFVTTLYGAATFSGYFFGWLAAHDGWHLASEIELVIPCVIAAALVLLLKTNRMESNRP